MCSNRGKVASGCRGGSVAHTSTLWRPAAAAAAAAPIRRPSPPLEAQLVHHALQLHTERRQRDAARQALRHDVSVALQQRRQLSVHLELRARQRRRARLQPADAEP